jgi:hypothetical protein
MTTGFSENDGGSTTVIPSTMRGRDWPCLRQFCVFLENRVGALAQMLGKLEQQDLRVVALSTVDSADFAVMRIMVDNYERGKEIFELSGFTFFENDVIGVELPDTPQPFVSICLALLQAELSINYSYPLLYRRRGRGAIALHVDDVETALQTLDQKGLTVVTEKQLLEDDEYL